MPQFDVPLPVHEEQAPGACVSAAPMALRGHHRAKLARRYGIKRAQRALRSALPPVTFALTAA